MNQLSDFSYFIFQFLLDFEEKTLTTHSRVLLDHAVILLRKAPQHHFRSDQRFVLIIGKSLPKDTIIEAMFVRLEDC